MSDSASDATAPAVNARLLFTASCIGLTCGAALFAITSDIAGALKQAFVLSNEQIGILLGWSGWGFAIGILALGPLCDALGMRLILRLAVVFHAVGILMMILANGFAMLFAGSFLTSLGSGAIEAACNPLVATIYPDKKTHKLNQFHMWFPGGIVLGGLGCYGLNAVGLGIWQLKLALALIPVVIYGILFTGQYFPPTERVQAGVSSTGMIRETLLRPLFLLLAVCMTMTASLELGPERWIPAVLQAGGISGILVLVWITGLQAVMRLAAGPVVRWFTNSGLLLSSAVLSGIGLLWLSRGGSIWQIGAAATIFAAGVAYFWPTMLGTVAERVPKGGALALALIGGIGNLSVNTVTTPLMGRIADGYLHQDLVSRQDATVAALDKVRTTYADWERSLGSSPMDAVTRRDIQAATGEVGKVLDAFQAQHALPEKDTANAFRIAVKNGPGGDESTQRSEPERLAWQAKMSAQGILDPADNRGGLMAFRYVAPLSLFLIVVFGAMFIQERGRKGSLRALRVNTEAQRRGDAEEMGE